MLKVLQESQLLQAGIVLVVVVSVLYYLSAYYGKENYMDVVSEIARSNDVAKDKYQAQAVSQVDPVLQTQQHEAVEEQAMEMAKISSDPESLLPTSTEADEWARANPETSGSVHEGNLLEAGFHIGVDTQTSTMKNASLDLRSSPPIPKEPVSIWNNSTILPDPYRRQFEIGASVF